MADEKTKTIHEVLFDIQQNLFVPKNQKNDHGKYRYRSCEDILHAVKPMLEKHGAVLLMESEPVVLGHSCGSVDKAGNPVVLEHDKVYIKTTARIRLGIGSEYVCTAYAREADSQRGMDPMQITGAATSYSRKYCLAGMFGIDNEKDADATNEHDKGTSPKQTASAPHEGAEVVSKANAKAHLDKITGAADGTIAQALVQEAKDWNVDGLSSSAWQQKLTDTFEEKWGA